MTKNIVICTDGTWNTPDQKDRGRVVPSNVVKMCRAVADHTKQGKQQLYFYDSGVGTGNAVDRALGGVFGIGLSRNVIEAYGYLIEKFEDGDDLYLFGFSRGAYTARSLAGLIGPCGIPQCPSGVTRSSAPWESEVLPIVNEALRIYRMKPTKPVLEQARTFREEHCHAANTIQFLGVWDTVGALGVPLKSLNWIGSWRYKFHDVSLGPHIRNAYHAVAIDERRRPFTPSLWEAANQAGGQTVVQAWFPGVHTNIGGGYADPGLSDRAFMWVKVNAENYGLGFEPEYVERRVDPNYHGELRDSMKPYYRAVERFIGDPTYAGQTIHFSAVARRDHPTNVYATDNLDDALSQGRVQASTRLPGE